MEAPEIFDIGRNALWVTIGISAPVMLIGLFVGVIIALLQTLTQIQEMTLVFVPKILVIFMALVLFLPMMGSSLGVFAEDIFIRIANF